jgi:hypothetical protein
MPNSPKLVEESLALPCGFRKVVDGTETVINTVVCQRQHTVIFTSFNLGNVFLDPCDVVMHCFTGDVFMAAFRGSRRRPR